MENIIILLGIPTCIYYSFCCYEKYKQYGMDELPGKIAETSNLLKKYVLWISLVKARPESRADFYSFTVAWLVVSAFFGLVCHSGSFAATQSESYLEWGIMIINGLVYFLFCLLIGVLLFGVSTVAIFSFRDSLAISRRMED